MTVNVVAAKNNRRDAKLVSQGYRCETGLRHSDE
jgi:hypothetical protein